MNEHDTSADQVSVLSEDHKSLLFHEQRIALCKMGDNRDWVTNLCTHVIMLHLIFPSERQKKAFSSVSLSSRFGVLTVIA